MCQWENYPLCFLRITIFFYLKRKALLWVVYRHFALLNCRNVLGTHFVYETDSNSKPTHLQSTVLLFLIDTSPNLSKNRNRTEVVWQYWSVEHLSSKLYFWKYNYS